MKELNEDIGGGRLKKLWEGVWVLFYSNGALPWNQLLLNLDSSKELVNYRGMYDINFNTQCVRRTMTVTENN